MKESISKESIGQSLQMSCEDYAKAARLRGHARKTILTGQNNLYQEEKTAEMTLGMNVLDDRANNPPSMREGDELTISVVSNGFVIKVPPDFGNNWPARIVAVFNDVDALCAFVKERFS